MQSEVIWSSTGRLSSLEFKVNPNLSSTSKMAAGFERGFVTVTGVGSVAVGGVLERGLAFGTGFGSVMVGVSLVFVVGVGATRAVFVVGVGPRRYWLSWGSEPRRVRSPRWWPYFYC